jgi:hypothetical protein
LSTLFTGIRGAILLALIASLVAFSGCGGGGGSSSSEVNVLPSKVLSWEAPTSYVDNSTMNPVTDLDRFEIYVNESGTFTETDVPMAELLAVDAQSNTLATSFDLANLSPNVTAGPKYYVSLRAVAITGLKSDFSPGVSFSF